MAALAVRVVDDHVERRQRPEIGGSRRHQREVVLAEVGDDELLQRARSHRAVLPIDREGHHLPVERGTNQVGGHLALPKRAVREIVEWRLSRCRFVDRESLAAGVPPHLGKVGVVGAIGHQPARLDAALAQQALLGGAVLELCGPRHR